MTERPARNAGFSIFWMSRVVFHFGRLRLSRFKSAEGDWLKSDRAESK